VVYDNLEDLRDEIPDRKILNLLTTYTAFVFEDALHRAHIRRIIHPDIFDDVSQLRFMAGLTINFPRSTRILDLKFVDDDHIMLLLNENDIFHLISLKYRGENPDFELIDEVQSDYDQAKLPHGTSRKIIAPKLQIPLERIGLYIKHTFTANDRLKPLKIEVNGRKDRRFVLVVGEDLRQLRILDLDFKEGHQDSEDVERKINDDDNVMSE